MVGLKEEGQEEADPSLSKLLRVLPINGVLIVTIPVLLLIFQLKKDFPYFFS